MERLSRRFLLRTVGAGTAARLLVGQDLPTGIRGRAIEHFSVQVSDLQRSLDFYRKLCGMVPVSEDRSKQLVRIGYGNRYLISLTQKQPYGVIDHYAVSVDDNDPKTLTEKLTAHGMSPFHTEDAGIYVKDPDGALVQIRGRATPPPEAGSGAVQVRMLHHVNTQVADIRRSEAFYRKVFGLGPSRKVQGPDNYGLDLPDGGLIILQTSESPGRFNHFCLGVNNFDADRMRAAVNDVLPGKVQGTGKDNFVVLDPDGVRVQISAPAWSA
jgi:catechol 2,3-dioxygenase-like lactoylglutathione lyase family enzyme